MTNHDSRNDYPIYHEALIHLVIWVRQFEQLIAAFPAAVITGVFSQTVGWAEGCPTLWAFGRVAGVSRFKLE